MIIEQYFISIITEGERPEQPLHVILSKAIKQRLRVAVSLRVATSSHIASDSRFASPHVNATLIVPRPKPE
ncbi:hypothetical protein MKX33_05180 [Paenibacillus sp. FSL R5-0490]|uniref:hypothetical protein n=1 Tax=Paenibacillus sp. FSL R5-0490 TaxID=1920424 RepID=UPI0030CC10FB